MLNTEYQMLSVIPLEKQHFKLISNWYNHEDKMIRIIHPEFQNRGGWVLFFTVMCPECQDTKTTWFALGVVKGSVSYASANPPFSNRTYIRKSSVQRFPQVQYVTKEGFVVDSPSTPEQIIDIDELIKFACKSSDMGGCCQNAHRSKC